MAKQTLLYFLIPPHTCIHADSGGGWIATPRGLFDWHLGGNCEGKRIRIQSLPDGRWSIWKSKGKLIRLDGYHADIQLYYRNSMRLVGQLVMAILVTGNFVPFSLDATRRWTYKGTDSFVDVRGSILIHMHKNYPFFLNNLFIFDGLYNPVLIITVFLV